jgi:hypothetical protein
VTKLIGKLWFGRFMVRFDPRSWMNSELSKDWLEVVWNRKPGILLRKRGCWFWMHLRNIFNTRVENQFGWTFPDLCRYSLSNEHFVSTVVIKL